MTLATRSRLAVAALAAACGLAASAVAASPAAATTARPATATQPNGAVTGDPGVSGPHRGSSTAVPAGTVLFTPIARPGAVTPDIGYSCTVSFPFVTDNFSNGEISWSATVSCNIVLRMQGTTVLFQWGSSNAYAFGSSYDHFASSSTSTGAVFGIFSGTWGVNDNVLLFSPPGYTSTPGAGCFYFNAAHTQIKCTETTGPFTAR